MSDDSSINGVWLKREYLQGGIIDVKLACCMCGFTSGHVERNWNYCPICGCRNYFSLEELLNSEAVSEIKKEAQKAANGEAEYMTMDEVFND